MVVVKGWRTEELEVMDMELQLYKVKELCSRMIATG
jgi:hypothetical protein